MRSTLALAAAVALLAACRGEPVPRDYQNAPPAMTHPPQTASESPGQHGMSQPTPEPSTGVEGTTTLPVSGTTETRAPQSAPVTTGTTGT